MGRSKTFKINIWHILVIGLLIVLYLNYTGQLKIPGLDVKDLLQPKKEEEKPQPKPEELVVVTKPIKFFLHDKYGGSGMGDYAIDIYDNNLVKLENVLTDSSGVVTTSQSYKSGTHLYLKVYDDDGATKEAMWYDVVVPKMAQADAEALTSNPMTLDFYDYTAPTIQVRDNFGNSYADNSNFNKTSGGTPGTSVTTITITWYQSTDNDGYIASYDPINQVNWDAWLIVKVSGTGYENVVISGFPYSVEKGTAMYYGYKIDPQTLTLWKVGNTYQLQGSGSVSFTIDLSGYTGDSADLDIYIYVFSDWNYFVNKGSFGPDAYSTLSGAPHTLNLVD